MTIKTSAWTHPRTKETRHYINLEEWAPAIADQAMLKDARVLKVWADANGQINISRMTDLAYYGYAELKSSETLKEVIEAYAASQGGFDFLAKEEEVATEVESREEQNQPAPAVQYTGTAPAAHPRPLKETQALELTGEEIQALESGDAAAVATLGHKRGVGNHEIQLAYIQHKTGQALKIPARYGWSRQMMVIRKAYEKALES